jgi:hypothetical protein
MRGLMSKLFLTCKRATELIEKQQTVGLTVTERIQLRSHLGMCHTCNFYARYSRKIETLIQSLLRKQASAPESNTALKQRITNTIDALKK